MDAVKAVYLIAKITGTQTTKIGTRLGRAKSFLSGMAHAGSVPSAHILADMLGVCGYSLVAVPSNQLPPDGIVIGVGSTAETSHVGTGADATSTDNASTDNTSTDTISA